VAYLVDTNVLVRLAAPADPRHQIARMQRGAWQEQQDLIDATCRRLVDQQVIEPLSTDEEETSRWNLRELASLIEGNFHVQLDLTGLSEFERLAYERRASWNGGPLPSPHSE